MRRRTSVWVPAVVSAAMMLAILAAACGASKAATHGDGPPASSDDHESIMAIVTCFRAHGAADFPDPVYDPGDGRWHFATSPAGVPAATGQSCQSLFPVTTPSPDLPQAQLQQLVRFAQCMRREGVTTWPDPAPDGYFHLAPDLWQLGKHGAVGRAMRACHVPNGGINVVPEG
jgi:hypothetical protein